MLRHNENLNNKEKVKYDLYKILRMSILLNQKEVDKLTLNKFKEASLNIDKMLSDEYDEKIEGMFYDTETLEEEEKRLKDLVAFIKDRIEKRKALLEDYRSVTSRDLDDVEYINKSNDLDLYESRLKTIKDYLENSKLIDVNEKDLDELKEQLIKEYDLKSSNELKNIKIEEVLYNTFVNILYEMELYSSLELDDVDTEIENLQDEIKETKEQKDTFMTAFDNLKASGISGELELEYASYVENSKRNYYYVKEKEIILRLYKLIEEKEAEYSDLYKKREDVRELLQERILLRKDLGIKDKDFMLKVFDLLDEQKEEIESEKENVDNINILTERIKLKENRLEELKRLVQKPEILSILKEFSLIDTYNHEDMLEESDDELEYDNVSLEEEDNGLEYDSVSIEETNDEDNGESALELLKDLLPEEDNYELEQSDNETVEEFTFEEESNEKTYQPNQIKESLVVPSMNFGLSRLKSISVMKRVGDMLGINAKKEPEVVIETKEKEIPKEEELPKQEETLETPKEVEEEKIDTKPEEQIVVQEEPAVETKTTEDLFWTPVEFREMQNETENNINNVPEKIFINQSELPASENQMFEFKMPEIKEESKDSQIFESTNSNNGLIFPEPVTPEIGQVLPENKEDKFMWPESTETFDINGIFPS